jgi:hypothetical protein
MAYLSNRLLEKYDYMILSRQVTKPLIHDFHKSSAGYPPACWGEFHLQQNFATYKRLISLRLENGCKKDRLCNVYYPLGRASSFRMRQSLSVQFRTNTRSTLTWGIYVPWERNIQQAHEKPMDIGNRPSSFCLGQE